MTHNVEFCMVRKQEVGARNGCFLERYLSASLTAVGR